MSQEISHLLDAIQGGDSRAANQLLPLVYEELRRLARAQMAREKLGQTLDATALVHEAYLRLIGNQHYASRRHFFTAAAEAMRRILVENARRKARLKHGGGRQRLELREEDVVVPPADARVLALNEALTKLSVQKPELAELVQLRYFAGLTVEEAAEMLGASTRTVKRNWAYASAWLRREMLREEGGDDPVRKPV